MESKAAIIMAVGATLMVIPAVFALKFAGLVWQIHLFALLGFVLLAGYIGMCVNFIASTKWRVAIWVTTLLYNIPGVIVALNVAWRFISRPPGYMTFDPRMLVLLWPSTACILCVVALVSLNQRRLKQIGEVN